MLGHERFSIAQYFISLYPNMKTKVIYSIWGINKRKVDLWKLSRASVPDVLAGYELRSEEGIELRKWRDD